MYEYKLTNNAMVSFLHTVAAHRDVASGTSQCQGLLRVPEAILSVALDVLRKTF